MQSRVYLMLEKSHSFKKDKGGQKTSLYSDKNKKESVCYTKKI